MIRVDRSAWGFLRAGTSSVLVGGVAAALALLGNGTPAAWAGDPLVVLSVKTAVETTVCDTNCSVCTIMSGECIAAHEFDLLVCRPLSSGLPITSCDWSKLLDGTSINVGIENQIRAIDVAPNGNLTMVVLNDDEVPTVGNLRKQDIAVFNPVDLLKPFTGGGPYIDGTYKLYLNGNLTQENNIDAKPWDALSILASGTCEKNISAIGSNDYTCPIVGSLTSGATAGPGLDGVHFENEDLLRCTPTGFNGHTVEACTFEMFLEADRINGVGLGINGDIEGIDFLSFTPSTMSGQMVFKMSGGNPPGFPVHDNGKDLLLYDGTFGAGNCVPSGQPCAGLGDCPMGDTECDTGSCVMGAGPCASDDDCMTGDTCDVTRDPAATVTKWFDGVAVGLTGAGQNIEAFAVLPDADGDGIPDGIDSCPNIANSPNHCSGPGDERCPGGLNSECPMGETCVQSLVQPDADGDGVGDECDQCNGRPDPGTCDLCPGAECPTICAGGSNAECECGDGIFDFPGEECDLGMSNGPPSPCSLTCEISGRCTRNMMVCTNGSECPQFATGEGCCGNNEVDDVDGMGGVIADEECDDGNGINNDLCSNICKAAGGPPILGCEDLTGPNILPASIKVAKFKDTEDAPDIDRWKTKGEAIFITGLTIDPDTEDVTIIYNNIPDGLLFSSTLAAGNFLQNDPKLKWKFKNKDANVPGSPGWRKGKFGIKQNKCKFLSDGRKTTLFTAMQIEPVNIRQTIRVGDVCITAVLDCAAKGSGYKCTIVP